MLAKHKLPPGLALWAALRNHVLRGDVLFWRAGPELRRVLDVPTTADRAPGEAPWVATLEIGHVDLSGADPQSFAAYRRVPLMPPADVDHDAIGDGIPY